MDNENTYMPETNTSTNEFVVGMGNKADMIPEVKAIGEEQLQKAQKILQEYKSARANLEQKIIDNEQWWKVRHWEQMRDKKNRYTANTAWLWNVIVSKHADMEDGYPEPNIQPREQGDEREAKILSDIIPVIIEQNDFHKTYSDCCWYKLKQGSCIYGIFWDNNKLNGLGDISIRKIDILNLFVEPGITDIQDSRNVFYTELVDTEILKQRYPQLVDKQLSSDAIIAKYLYDDNVDTTDKATVVDWYYKKEIDGKSILHYVKFVGNNVLYATENETVPPTKPMIDPMTGTPAVNPDTGNTITEPIGKSLAEVGLYDHGKYPFVVDSLYDIEGSPFGYGITDISKDTQVSIDQLNSAIVKNALMASKRRYFVSDVSDINTEEFSDWEQDIVHVTGSLEDERVREITVNPLSSTYVNILNNQIEMLKETSGNRDVNNGGTTSGVTAASAIAALQEQGNKQSRDVISTTYEAYKSIVYFVIELIRQFYDTPRQFRILGESGQQQFVSYMNSGIKPQDQGMAFGRDMGYRVPQFDISVTASRANPYSKMSQNELALQFYQLGFFNPSNATQTMACLDMMDFDGKDETMQKVQQNGTLLQLFNQIFQTCMGMAQAYDPNVIPSLQQMALQAGVIDQTQIIDQPSKRLADIKETDATGAVKSEEHPFVEKARKEAQANPQPR